MDNLLLYLLKVSAGTALLYLCYLLLFRKDTFYRRNRIFLILTLLMPTIFPAIKIPVLSDAVTPATPVIAMENMIFPESTYESAISGTINSFDYNNLFIWIYFTITGLLLLRIIISLVSTYRIIKKGTLKNDQFPKVIVSEEKIPPFSFFPYAVIPVEEFEKGNYIDLLDHEFAHIRQGHTIDLLLSELFIAFQWFNPFVWFIKRSIILNHEYLADLVSVNNKSIKEYQYRLLNFQTGLKHISLAHNFNSLIKNRIIMINKKPTRKYATLKNILILPVVAFVLYAFATPEYHYSVAPSNDNALSIYQPAVILQKEVKGIVLKEDGKPLEGVSIMSTGTMGNARGTNSGSDGRFKIYFPEEDTYLSFMLRGYKGQSIKADFTKEMIIKMVKDPEYKEPKYENAPKEGAPPVQLVTLDGVITKEPVAVINSKLGAELGTIKYLTGKEATDKYGEAGKNGVTEIYSRKKAAELGIKIPFRRIGPDDYPTFQGDNHTKFTDWVVSQLKYPAEATAKGIHGRIIVNYTIESDGTVSKVSLMGNPYPLLGDAAVKAVQASPKWEPAKNPEAKDPYSSMVAVKFELPDKITKDDTYVMVEKMPQYPGGDVELLNFIKNNTNYPEAAKADKIEGRVIVRFVVNKNGNTEDPVILKGINPILDAEAIRVVGILKGFSPGTLGGNPVNVYYMVPVNFSIPATVPSK
jgi:TonB family protein